MIELVIIVYLLIISWYTCAINKFSMYSATNLWFYNSKFSLIQGRWMTDNIKENKPNNFSMKLFLNVKMANNLILFRLCG